MNIKKVLISNRGEIVFRISKTLKKMNLQTVSIFTEADEDSPHRYCTDNSVLIESDEGPCSGYLDQNKIIDAAKKTGSNAIHPGFGFLSENHEFAKKVRDAGIYFIGPSHETIELMGDKVEAKKTAMRCGVPVIMGSQGSVESKSEAIKISEEIGYPVMLKASAGGGGKGMKILSSKEELIEVWDAMISESKNLFKNSKMLIEKYIEEPRHIEIQIICDKQGNTKCLGERECSIQRRHQKIIEETPSAFVDQNLRQKMFLSCEMLAKEIKYHSAGTIEFLVDKNKNFFFLEANTRIQVEHAITEMVTGVDIVEQMIKIEEGQNIKDLSFSASGHSIEARVYAEDYKNDFLPSAGQIIEYIEPKNDQNLRIESGVFAGTTISSFYDPMISKVCVKEKDRKTAIKKLISSLERYFISGELTTNINFLILILKNKNFIDGKTTTNFIKENFDGFDFDNAKEKEQEIILIFAFYFFKKINSPEEKSFYLILDNKIKKAKISEQNDLMALSIENSIFVIKELNFSKNILELEINNKHLVAQVKYKNQKIIIAFSGYEKEVKIYSDKGIDEQSVKKLFEVEFAKKTNEKKDNLIVAPLAGLVVDVFVSNNDFVKKGQPLICIESMKMQNTIRSAFSCKIISIKVSVGSSINKNDLLIETEIIKE